MSQANAFAVNPGWRVLLSDFGLNPANVLRRAELPGDLFARQQAHLSTAEYFRLWRALQDESGDPTLPIRLGSGISVEAFDPPIFAALCSPNLNIALQRIARYKTLTCPVALTIDIQPDRTSMQIEWLAHADTPARLACWGRAGVFCATRPSGHPHARAAAGHHQPHPFAAAGRLHRLFRHAGTPGAPLPAGFFGGRRSSPLSNGQ